MVVVCTGQWLVNILKKYTCIVYVKNPLWKNSQQAKEICTCEIKRTLLFTYQNRRYDSDFNCPKSH